MGQIPIELSHQLRYVPQAEFLRDKSLSKMEEFYNLYKNISDTFSIDDTQFKQIFGEYHPIFALLDCKHNLLIDGLELFAGMALFSKIIKFEDKVQFIFKLYDFNNLKSLSLTDLEFMFLSCCTVTYKLLGAKSSLREEVVISFVHEVFNNDRRINISEIKKWANSSPVANDFVRTIHLCSNPQPDLHSQEDLIRNKEKSDNRQILAKSTQTLLAHKIYRKFAQKSLSSDSNSHKKDEEVSKWLFQTHNFFEDKEDKAQNNPNLKQKSPNDENLQNCEIQFGVKWVYGIRFKDVKYFIEVINTHEIAYFVGKVAIILNTKSCQQRHYKQHRNPITAIIKYEEILVTSDDASSLNDDFDEFPEIRIWNSRTLSTSKVIKGLHKGAVHLLKFTNSGNYLVTCGNLRISPIVIYQVDRDYEPVYSTSSIYPTVEIASFFGILNSLSDEFIVASLYGLKHFRIHQKLRQSEIEQNDIDCQQNGNLEPETTNIVRSASFSAITCCAALCLNCSLVYLSGYDQEKQKLIITGHEKGEVMVWSCQHQKHLFVLSHQSCQITQILPFKNSLLICSNSSIMSFWDIDLAERNRIETIDITSLDIQIKSYEIAYAVPNTNNGFLFVTCSGDLFNLDKERKKMSKLKYRLVGAKYEATIVDKIINIDSQICSHKLLEMSQGCNFLIFGSVEGSIQIINLKSHCQVFIWKIGEQIVCFDCYESKQGGLEVIAATKNRKIYMNSNLIERNERIEMEKQVCCIKFCPSSGLLAIALEDNSLNFMGVCTRTIMNTSNHLFPHKTDETWIVNNLYEYARVLRSNKGKKEAPTQNDQNQKPTVVKKIDFPARITDLQILDKKMILVETQENKFYLLSLKDFYFKAISENNCLSANLLSNRCIEAYYTVKQKGTRSKLPVVMGPHSKAIIACAANGTLYSWKNNYQIGLNNCIEHTLHNGVCTSLSFNRKQSRFYSCGKKDGMIVQSSVLYFYQVDQSLVNPGPSLVSTENEYQIGEQRSEFVIRDPLLERQINFSTFNSEITTELYDQNILIRGLENKTLRELFKGMSKNWRHLNELSDVKQAPHLNLRLNYVYGIETFNTRSTILTFQNSLIFVYFVSNQVIIYERKYNRQKIYRGHRFRVTCIVQVSEDSIASGQAAYQAHINIWNHETLETTLRIETGHRWGIVRLVCQNNLLLSYGIFNKKLGIYNLDLHNHPTGELIARRNIREAIYSMAINPLHTNEFVTTSEEAITFWKVGNSHSRYFRDSIRKIVVIETNEPVTSCIYRLTSIGMTNEQYHGERFKEELITGNKTGQLSIIANHCKLIDVQKKAHTKQVNCLQYVNYQHEGDDSLGKFLNRNIKYLISSSEDETVKIWNKQFELLCEYNMRSVEYEEHNSYAGNSTSNWLHSGSERSMNANVSVQSISVAKDSTNYFKVLLGTRSGDLLMMRQSEKGEELAKEYKRLQNSSLNKRRMVKRSTSHRKTKIGSLSEEKTDSLKHKQIRASGKGESKQIQLASQKHRKAEKQNKINKEAIGFVLYLRNHCSQNSFNMESEARNTCKILFAHHPKHEMIVTISDDQNLLFWDTERNKLVMNRALNYVAQPTSLKFSRDGDILIIGHSDGCLILLQSIISRSDQEKGNENFVLPTLRILKKIRDDQNCAVLNIEVSETGDHLAVSYNNRMKKQGGIIEPSHISLFVSKSREKVKNKVSNKIEYSGIFEKFTTIPCQQAESIFTTEHGNKYGMAAYSMTFTESEGKNYLLFYEQLIDSNHNRLNYFKKGDYTLWDVNTSTVIANLEPFANFNWEKISVPNSVYTRYQLYNKLTSRDRINWETNLHFQTQRKEETSLQGNYLNVNKNLLIPYMTSMLKLSHHIVLGSVNGDLHLAQASCLEFGSMIEQLPNNQEMFLAKTFPAHCSQISHIETNHSKTIIYSSSMCGKAVSKWVIDGNDEIVLNPNPQKLHNPTSFKPLYQDRNDPESQMLKYNEQIVEEEQDIFNEVPSKKAVETVMQLYQLKDNIRIQRSMAGRNEGIQKELKERIRLVNVIGRKANEIRQNLFYDSRKQIVYSSGHAICNVRLSGEHLRHSAGSDFLHITNSNQAIEEIHLIKLSNDRKFVYSCHNGIQASLCMWEIYSKLKLKTIYFSNLIQVLQMIVSENNSTAVVYGITVRLEALLMMVCLQSGKTLGALDLKKQAVWHFKDMVFYPSSHEKFVSCGVNETLSYELMGNQLTSETLSSPFEENPSKIINICIGFTATGRRIVTGCDNGDLGMWGDYASVLPKHHDEIVMVISSCQPNLFLSGSRDGVLVIWNEPKEGLGLRMISKIVLRDAGLSTHSPLNMETKQNINISCMPKNRKDKNTYEQGKHNSNMDRIGIQSIDALFSEDLLKQPAGNQMASTARNQPQAILCEKQEPKEKDMMNEDMNQSQRWKLIMGTVSGDIFEANLCLRLHREMEIEQAHQIIKFHDHQIPKSFFFSNNDKFIYSITNKGCLSCRSLSNLGLIFEQAFNTETIDMLYSAKNNTFFIIFSGEVKGFELEECYLSSLQTTIKQVSTIEVKFITHAALSNNEKMLAIGYQKSSDDSISVQVYDVSDKREIRKLLNIPVKNKEPIEFLDFSRSNEIILVRLENGTSIPKDLARNQVIHEYMVKSIEWTSYAQKLSQRNIQILRDMHTFASEQEETNDKYEWVVHVEEVVADIFIIIDMYGSVQMVNKRGKVLSRAKLRITDPSVVRLSSSKTVIGVSSEADRNIVVFEISVNEEMLD